MAGTFATLMLGGLGTLVQSVSPRLGVLIDTFIVRPFLVPTFTLYVRLLRKEVCAATRRQPQRLSQRRRTRPVAAARSGARLRFSNQDCNRKRAPLVFLTADYFAGFAGFAALAGFAGVSGLPLTFAFSMRCSCDFLRDARFG